MEVQLTQRAAAEYDHLRSGSMTPEMAAQYLKDGNILLRSFRETLQELYPYSDLQLRLTNAFQIYEPESHPDSVVRKVSNWLTGRNRPSRREDVFKIAFALNMTEVQANLLLEQCTEYGIHYRDGRDVIYTWFLRHNYGYMEARTFFNTLPPMPDPSGFPDISLLSGRKNPDSPSRIHITRNLQNSFHAIHDIERLRKTYIRNLPQFGKLHIRAWQYFDKYLRQLTRPNCSWDEFDEENYSLEAVMDNYLSLHMPSRRSRAGYTAVQKLLKQNWPNATTLKNIQAHKADVPRKLLLILYVVTENVVDDEYNELDEDYLSLQDKLEDHWWVLNAILTDCGMPSLDPRNITDWLVLYALTAGSNESMSERMSHVIENMF